jgi:hypothetical protein
MFVNVYCPNEFNERINFFRNTSGWVEDHKITKDNVFVMGDVNCVDDPVDRVSHVLDASSKVFKSFKLNLEIKDVWNDLINDDKGYTFIDPSLRGRNSRIDVILSSYPILPFAKQIAKAPVPDHKAVMLTFCNITNPRGKGYWKLNTEILKDECYINNINALIEESVQNYSEHLSSKQLWKFIKMCLKEHFIRFSIKRKKAQKREIMKLEIEINKLDNSLANTNPESNGFGL